MIWTVQMLSKTRKKTTKKVAKKATKKVVKKAAKKTAVADKAHQPGHRKMKIEGLDEALTNRNAIRDSTEVDLSKTDFNKRKTSKNRRIITGAAIGKTGRITIKE